MDGGTLSVSSLNVDTDDDVDIFFLTGFLVLLAYNQIQSGLGVGFGDLCVDSPAALTLSALCCC